MRTTNVSTGAEPHAIRRSWESPRLASSIATSPLVRSWTVVSIAIARPASRAGPSVPPLAGAVIRRGAGLRAWARAPVSAHPLPLRAFDRASSSSSGQLFVREQVCGHGPEPRAYPHGELDVRE